jgi:hypothetical protein
MSPMPTKVLLSTFVVQLILGSSIVNSVAAPKRAASTASQTSALEECCKQQGGTYDPALKRCGIYTFSETIMTGAHDTLRQCLSSKTGVRRDQIPIQTRNLDKPGANY